ncbi:uncharacterized protein N7529_005421 [Penicillium soppii]|jgi:hypothetical protein|uniref:uncharacterized protein n=1 Tax=Penicillium soppii TaxID=69789 RepID=UPI002547631F|nr:uncharacterized protein N7529_005421 [Penicillium soppii]KAJ5873068.1 hypothetical protein N7529_005421 [Penicillium soppii]
MHHIHQPIKVCYRLWYFNGWETKDLGDNIRSHSPMLDDGSGQRKEGSHQRLPMDDASIDAQTY